MQLAISVGIICKMTYRNSLFIFLQKLLPKKTLSFLVGLVASCSQDWFSNYTKKLFLWYYKVDLSEAESNRIQSYQSLNSLFTRKLQNKARPQPTDASVWSAPADGTLTEFGTICSGQIVQAKGINYSIADLFDADIRMARIFETGKFACIYLAPHNYHRVHMPTDGLLRNIRYVPGDLFSVNKITSQAIDNLFCRNERVALLFEKSGGHFAIVMVGACLVGGIALTLPAIDRAPSEQIASKCWSPGITHKLTGPSIHRGAEVGYFYFGSTVVFLSSQDLLDWDSNLVTGTEMRVGLPWAQTPLRRSN